MIWLEDATDVAEENIVTSTRIGIEGAGVASASKPYRFYEKDNDSVSVLDPDDKTRRQKDINEKKKAAKRLKKSK